MFYKIAVVFVLFSYFLIFCLKSWTFHTKYNFLIFGVNYINSKVRKTNLTSFYQQDCGIELAIQFDCSSMPQRPRHLKW